MNLMISLGLILLLAVVGGLIGLAVARSRQTTTESPSHESHTPTERTSAPTGDRTWVLCLLIGVLCALLIIMGSRVSTLSGEIDVLRSDLAAMRSQLSSQIAGISSSLRTEMEAHSRLVLTAESRFGALDPDTATVAMTVTVVPKTVTEDTSLALTVDGATVEMTRGEGNAFTVTVPVGLFDYGDAYPTLAITSGGVTQTELLTEVGYVHLWAQYLPTMGADMGGRTTWSSGKLKLDHTLSLNVEEAPVALADHGRETYFTSVALVTEIDGREVSREDLTEALTSPQVGRITSASLDRPYQKTLTVAEQETVKIYVIATDSLGYVHRVNVSTWDGDGGGISVETVLGGECIYSAEGELLYGWKQ